MEQQGVICREKMARKAIQIQKMAARTIFVVPCRDDMTARCFLSCRSTMYHSPVDQGTVAAMVADVNG